MTWLVQHLPTKKVRRVVSYVGDDMLQLAQVIKHEGQTLWLVPRSDCTSWYGMDPRE